MSNLAPGRVHDMQMLQDRLQRATSYQERYEIQRKIDLLVKEGKDPVLQSLRYQLVNAARANDNEAGDQISEQIYRHVNKGRKET